MSCRNHCWRIILFLCSCAPLLHHDNDLARGLELYQDGKYAAAVNHFKSYHDQHPDHDSTLYYLYACYKQMNKDEEQMDILEKLVQRNTLDENVYLNLVYFYRKHGRFKDLYSLLSSFPNDIQDKLDSQLALTRRVFAELICGACRSNVKGDPLIYSSSKGYFPVSPDGQLYAEDTLSYANLIVLLDRLVEPEYPRNFFPMKNVSTKSYLYLPYMRLVDSGILSFDPYLAPDLPARVSTAVRAVGVLMQRGHLD
ncbi:MAG: tetratricopeptide repeat protein [candidate division WOR-3 bacterium]|jgi:tetratricopeptide (TPR) repeat protein